MGNKKVCLEVLVNTRQAFSDGKRYLERVEMYGFRSTIGSKYQGGGSTIGGKQIGKCVLDRQQGGVVSFRQITSIGYIYRA